MKDATRPYRGDETTGFQSPAQDHIEPVLDLAQLLDLRRPQRYPVRVIGQALSARGIHHGDVLVVNGTLGDHGIAVMSQREGFDINLGVQSDVAPLNGLIAVALEAAPNIHFMRDLTRGGLAAVTNEMVRNKPFGVRVFDAQVPFQENVLEYAEMLGLDPLLVANEGKVLFCVPRIEADALLSALRTHPLGREAAIIGDVIRKPASMAIIETAYGSRRVLEMPLEEQLPRIC